MAHGVVARALLRRAVVAARDAAQALVDRTGARLLAPALAEWRAELAGVMGDEVQRQTWLEDAVRGCAETGAHNTMLRAAAQSPLAAVH